MNVILKLAHVSGPFVRGRRSAGLQRRFFVPQETAGDREEPVARLRRLQKVRVQEPYYN